MRKRNFLIYKLGILLGIMFFVSCLAEARFQIGPETPIHVFDDNSSWSWKNDGRNVTFTLSTDTANKVEGNASLKVEYSVPTNAVNQYAYISWKPTGGQDWSSPAFDRISFWVKFAPGSQFNYLLFWMCGGGAGSTNTAKQFNYSAELVDGNWHELVVTKADLNWDNFKYPDFVYEIRFLLRTRDSGTPGDSGTFWLDFFSPYMALREVSGAIAPDAGVDLNFPNRPVTLKHSSSSRTYTTTTAADGTFSWPTVMGGTYTLEIEEPGYQKYTREVIVNRDSPTPLALGDITLTPVAGSKIVAFTVDQEEFAPVLGSKIGINYEIRKNSFVTLEVLQGSQRVRTLRAKTVQGPGTAGFVWDGTDEAGNVLDAGDYRIRLTAERNDEAPEQQEATVRISNRMPLVYIAPQNAENPKHEFQLAFTVASGTTLAFKFFDQGGKEVFSQNLVAQGGEVNLTWNGTDNQGKPVGEGKYDFILTVTPAGQTGQNFYGSVVVDNTPPAPPQAVLPVKDATITESRPLLRWEGAADSYLLIYSPNPDLSGGRQITTNKPQWQLDEDLAAGQWYWQVVGIDLAGNRSRENPVNAFRITSLDREKLDLPFLAIGPNPFSPGGDGRRDQLQVSYTLTQPAEVRIEIFNLAGKLVARSEAERMEAGDHLWSWDGTDCYGRRVGSGLYLLKVRMVKLETLEVGERIKPVMVLY